MFFKCKTIRIYNSRNYQSLLAFVISLTTTSIYNSRNYQSLLASRQATQYYESTIVEIIRAYQPPLFPYPSSIIYNSRNYQSLLALVSRTLDTLDLQQQKLLELTSHNLRLTEQPNLQQQKLLELTSPSFIDPWRVPIYNSRNYQSLLANNKGEKTILYLQQQKLLELTSLQTVSILTRVSTIVEIIRAYQPSMSHFKCCDYDLQQQKLLELTSLRFS